MYETQTTVFHYRTLLGSNIHSAYEYIAACVQTPIGEELKTI